MNHEQTITNLIHLMNKVCQLKEAGVNVTHEECPTDLSWVWRNQDTGRTVDTVKLSRMKAIVQFKQTDPRIKYLIAFVAGGDALAARDAINKLGKLKAFW